MSDLLQLLVSALEKCDVRPMPYIKFQIIRAEPEYMNIHTSINALAPPLAKSSVYVQERNLCCWTHLVYKQFLNLYYIQLFSCAPVHSQKYYVLSTSHSS